MGRKWIEPRHTIASIVSSSIKSSPLAQRDEPDAGITELYNVPATQIDMIVGLVANGPNLSGGFCAGSHIVVDHQRINGTTFVFSVAVPALTSCETRHLSLAAAGECARDLGRSRSGRGLHDPLACRLVDHPHPPALCGDAICTHILVCEPPNPATPAPREAPSFDIAGEERLLQDIVDKALAQGVWILHSRKESERAASVIWAAVTKVLAKRK
ncbi:hypothetical protein EDB83DRAFT_2678146 [Lactarius deliciosus]|nr:hypothetical protein EDB83DRAFT_2678146 [Lactarius deliciosus]